MVAADEYDIPHVYADLEIDGHIDHLYCAPEVAGLGVASALYDELEEIAREERMDRLYTEASEAARRLFLRKGFAFSRKREFDINGVSFHNYAMEKLL